MLKKTANRRTTKKAGHDETVTQADGTDEIDTLKDALSAAEDKEEKRETRLSQAQGEAGRLEETFAQRGSELVGPAGQIGDLKKKIADLDAVVRRKSRNINRLENLLEQTTLEKIKITTLAIQFNQLFEETLLSRRWRAGNLLAHFYNSLVPEFLRPALFSFIRALILHNAQSVESIRSNFSPKYTKLNKGLNKVLFQKQRSERLSNRNGWRENSKPLAPKSRLIGKVSIITVLYNKSDTVERFVEAFARQDFPGQIEIIFIDDVSTDSGQDIVKNLKKKYANTAIDICLHINAENIGNCGSRNRGLEIATGDMIVIIDADCIVNTTFVSAHIQQHNSGFDVCIGPVGIEARGRDVNQLVTILDGDMEAIRKEMHLQCPAHLNSSVNCITRNFSITSAFLKRIDRPLFDERFSYRNAPDTGFGWEDVEMGTMLYESGASIAFSWQAFSVHVTHPPEVQDCVKARGSLKNFNRLLEQRPGLYEREPGWVETTGRKIQIWRQKYHAGNNELDSVLARVFETKSSQVSRQGKIIIYSAVAGGYDNLNPVVVEGEDVEYWCFLDDLEQPDGWQTREFDFTNADPCRTAKKPKLLPHIYFPTAEWSIWIDGNIDVVADPYTLISEVDQSGCHIGVFRHPERKCIYDEQERCITGNKDNPTTILDQIDLYHGEGYPRNNGLAECNVIVRRHNHPEVLKVMCDWWREVENGSRRDQLSFPYVLWKNNVLYCELNKGIGNVRTDKRFVYRPRLIDMRKHIKC